MFARLVEAGHQFADREAIVMAEGAIAWGDLASLSARLAETHPTLASRRIGLVFTPTAAGFAMLAGLDRLAADVFLFDAQLSADEIHQLASEFRLAAILTPVDVHGAPADVRVELLPHESLGSGASTITILTSGTTGKPKAARHTWASLSRPVRSSNDSAAPRWLLSYRPQLYAGLQVILQAFANRGTLIVPERNASVDAIAHLMVSGRVEFASATPSYWRRMLLFAPHEVLRRAPLQQITLGGEAIDQQVLDGLAQLFPTARIVHIYATTELGRCFSVTDRLAGFPARFLKEISPDGIELKIDGGQLLVRSANAMQGYDSLTAEPSRDDDWFATGDLVEIVDDRVHFVGRESEIINVGGNKVHPFEVEQVLRRVPGVSDARVYGKISSIAGQVVACELVAAPGADPKQVRDAAAARCLADLQSYQRPRLFQLVDHIELSAAGKKTRRAAP